MSPGWEAEIARFTEQTGIEVRLVNNNDFQGTIALANGRLEATPDVVAFYSATPPWARPRAVDLSRFLDEATLRSDFGDYLIDLFSLPVDGGEDEVVSVPTNLGPKGLVFYPRAAFAEAGYAIPTTWDELVSLSEQIAADGRTPWCFNWEAGFASGWPGSDFLEGLVLRAGGVDAYDAWVTGDLAFDSPIVREAATLGEKPLFTPGFVRGGSDAISQEAWQFPLVNMLDVDPWTGASGPQCWLVHQTFQQAGVLGEDTDLGPRGRLGTDVDFFPLPQLDDTGASLVVGGGFATTALADRPEVRAFLRFVAEPTFGEGWAAIAEPASVGIGDVFISPNRRFDPSAYETDHGDAEDARVRIAMHEYSRAALDAGTWRFDMSDQMPPAFGAWTPDLVPGAIWQGMIDWADRTKPIDEILADLDAARAEIDARSAD